MYLPRLRARRHEVLAVRNCATALAETGKVTPIIEPVDSLNDVLANRICRIGEDGLSCDLVLNPSVGEFRGRDGWRPVAQFYLDKGLLGDHSIAILSNSEADHEALAQWINETRQHGFHFSLDVIHEMDLSISLQGTTYSDVRWNVALDRTVPAAYGLPLSGKPVIWSSDPFPDMSRNVDYVGRSEGIFTTRVSSYRSAGYTGLSDFATVGGRFQTGGGPARAVVIHLTYAHDDVIRLVHFCSDSNESTSDPGGKFLEALNKLVAFVNDRHIPANTAVRKFIDLDSRQHFPGLGAVKQLSIENHILVMDSAV